MCRSVSAILLVSVLGTQSSAFQAIEHERKNLTHKRTVSPQQQRTQLLHQQL